MSSVSAADNVTDVVANDAATEDVATALSEEVSDDVENNDVLASEEDSPLATAESNDVLSVMDANSDLYSINLEDNYEISGKNGGNVRYYLTPYTAYSPIYGSWAAYNFYFALYPGDNSKSSPVNLGNFASDTDTASGYRILQINAKSLAPGTYILKAINTYDGKVMDSATLKVSGNAVITAADYNQYYYSGNKMTATIKDKDTGLAVKYAQFKVVFSNAKKTVTKYYTTNANGVISFVPGIGTWNVTFSSNEAHIKGNAVKVKMVVKKSNVAVKAYGVKGYEGLKVTLKAVVKSQGKKNVNEGTVTFVLNGKTYKAAVKNGVATKKVTLPKAKTYNYAAIFNGKNFNSPKKALAKAVSLKRYATKLIFKKVNVYYRSVKAAKTPFYVYVRTADGKVVPGGKVKIIDTVKVNKKGVAKFYLPTNLCFIKTQYMVIHYFHKVATKTYAVKYIPASNKYKPCTAKVVFREYYKCIGCGSTTSHQHSDSTYIVS